MNDEYLSLREEVAQRAILLHQLINTATWLTTASLFLIIYLLFAGAERQLIDLLLTFLPIIFAGLTFNYQANQMTLEAVAYRCDRLGKRQQKENATSWDDDYGRHKQKYQLTSFLKVVPLLLPQITSLILAAFGLLTNSALINFLIGIDLLLFVLVLFNFRYKISR